MLEIIRSLTEQQKYIVMLLLDLLLVAVALLFVVILNSGRVWPGDYAGQLVAGLPYVLLVAAGAAALFGTPAIRLNEVGAEAVWRISKMAWVTAAGLSLVGYFARAPLALDFAVVFGLVLVLFSLAARLALSAVLTRLYLKSGDQCRVLIYGAGTTGRQIASALRTHTSVHAVAFIDDNPALHRVLVAGLPVYRPSQLETVAQDKQIDRVLLAMPSLSAPKRARLANRLQRLGLEVRSLPSFAQLIGEEPLIAKLIDPSPEVYLGRSAVAGSRDLQREEYRDHVVMVTGAGGSIGSELSRQLLESRPRKLVLFEVSELALYTLEMELRSLALEAGVELVPVLGSVCKPGEVRRALERHDVDVVMHAAAYKHVPMVEQNPLAGLDNNVVGTHVVAREAIAAGVGRFILVSTDKAVRPTNVMGASKRLAEYVVLDLASRATDTVFGVVRFGNVLGSSGSVVPLFQEQIQRGGPVTVTDPRVARYFMTVEEAVHLVLTAGAMADGGEIYVLDMGDPVPIMKLARDMIERSGYSVKDDATPDGDIEIRITGLRPGEKLREQLTIGDGLLLTDVDKIRRAQEPVLSEIEVAGLMRELQAALDSSDADRARAVTTRYLGAETEADAAVSP